MRALLNRLRRIEQATGNGEPPPTLFICITDAGLPDPDHPEQGPADFSEDAIVGYAIGHSHKVSRRVGESIEALQERATRLAPDVRVFMASYAGHDFHDGFAKAQEVGA